MNPIKSIWNRKRHIKVHLFSTWENYNKKRTHNYTILHNSEFTESALTSKDSHNYVAWRILWQKESKSCKKWCACTKVTPRRLIVNTFFLVWFSVSFWSLNKININHTKKTNIQLVNFFLYKQCEKYTR